MASMDSVSQVSLWEMRKLSLVNTQHGFRFGAMTVEATSVLPQGHTVVTIRTDAGQEIDVYCSPTGRRLRAFRKGKGEMKP